MNDFHCYYADDAKNGFISSAIADNWSINSSGQLERLLPYGKQYWMSNSDVYQSYGVGLMEYGMVTNLVYSGREYVNFELEVDMRRPSGINRLSAIGFGQKGNAFFTDADSNMNPDGGAYAYISRSGETAIWGYIENTVNSANGKLANNGRVLGINAGGNQGDWNRVKLVVQNGYATMYIKNIGADDSAYIKVVSVALKNYSGGYISLSTSANGAFDNLRIKNLDNEERKIKVACIGDSITTSGFWHNNLNGMLDTDYQVAGFGVNGATALSCGIDNDQSGKSYIDQAAYRDSIDFAPDIVIIMLGTNDSKSFNWYNPQNTDGAEFIRSYTDLVEAYQALPAMPKVILALPPTAFSNLYQISNETIENSIIPAIEHVAELTGSGIIDIHSATSSYKDDFADGIHPSTDAAKDAIALKYAAAVNSYVNALPFDLKKMSVAEYHKNNPGMVNIIKTENVSEIMASVGTTESDLGLPETVVGYEKDGTPHTLSVSWSADTVYNPNSVGEYTFTGTLSTSENLYLEISRLTVTVSVVDYDFTKTVKYSFNDYSELADFASYYADNAKNGFMASPMEKNWSINSDGVLERVQPEGKEYWMSNGDVNEQYGVGLSEYGLVSSLIFKKRKYTDFELEADMRRVTGTTRLTAVGFGIQDEKAFFVDSDNNMNYDGGAYAYVNRSGETALWGYLKNTVDSATGKLTNNGRVLGMNIGGEQGTWCHLKLVVSNNTVKMYIDGVLVVNTLLNNYTGGYISLSTSANAAFDNLSITDLGTPEYPEIVSVKNPEPIEVSYNSDIESVVFPSTVRISDENGAEYDCPVSFKCDDFDGTVPGIYTFIGTLDYSKLPVSNIGSISAQLLVTVETKEVTENTVRISFDSSSDLNKFSAYYSENAKNGYKEISGDEKWQISGSSTLMRIQDEFWRSNVSGAHEYGMISNLVYNDREYTNFILDVDFKTPTDITRYAMVGFGQRPGEFFIDCDNNMYLNGGLYAYVSRSGETALWGYMQKTVDNSTRKMGNNARVTGTSIENYVSGKWVHLKLVVSGQSAMMYVDGTLVNTVALKGYYGGYISLASNAQVEFDNLRITDMGDNCTGNIVSVEEITTQVITTGAATGDYYLPDFVMVRDEIGNEKACPVSWSCDGFSKYKVGKYTFVGTLDGKKVLLRNPNSVIAKAVVVVKSEPSVTNTVAYSFDDVEQLSDFTATYALDARQNKNFSSVKASQFWQINENGMLERLDNDFWYEPNDEFNKIASLTYKAKKYTDFELNVDYQHGTKTSKWAMVVFGQNQAGSFIYEKDGSVAAYVEREGLPVYWGNVEDRNDVSKRIRNEEDRIAGYYSKDSSDNLITHHLRLVVSGGYSFMYVDDEEPIVAKLTKEYTGGYISLMCNTDVKYDNLTITDLESGNNQIITSVERIDKKVLDGIIELPKFITVNTNNGYQYACKVIWSSSDYRPTVSGVYNFVGTLVLPFATVKNPYNIQVAATVNHKIDYDPKTTVKYYFDSEWDLDDFECFYASRVDNGFSVVDPLEKWKITDDGMLYRLNENFSRQYDPKDEQTDKVSMLTYKGGTFKDFEINVDYKRGTKTYFWAMVGFGETKVAKYMTQDGGGYAAYFENEGRPVFWGPLVNVNHETDRLRPPTLWFNEYNTDPNAIHHLKLVVKNKLAYLYLDDFTTPLVAQLGDDYIGGYISLISCSNDVSFDNFSITRLNENSPYRFDDAIAEDIDSIVLTHNLSENDNKQDAVVEKDNKDASGGIGVKTVVLFVTPIVLIISGGMSGFIYYRKKVGSRK